MGKISAKGVMAAFLSMLLLLQLSSLVAALDIIFYESTLQCGGSGYAFNGIAGHTCCVVGAKDGGSVLVKAGSSQASLFYRDGGCTTQVLPVARHGNVCLLGGQFTGAYWYNARRRSLLTDSQTCDSQTKPTGVVFTEDGAKGHWILTTSEATEMYSQMQNVPDAEKSNWLASHGATYVHL